ncbi:MAG: hypothetical protein Q9191_004305 [Dirinaria sp. TL-2023a]
MATSYQKPVHSIVLDAGPILKNDPPISTLLAKSEQLFSIPSVVSEIRDLNARSRIETTLIPFLTIRDPSINSIKLVTEFARKTGDLAVLSNTDVAVLALAYELECDRNGGDWRLRRSPGQQGINGPVPQKIESQVTKESTEGKQLTLAEHTQQEPDCHNDVAFVGNSIDDSISRDLQKCKIAEEGSSTAVQTTIIYKVHQESNDESTITTGQSVEHTSETDNSDSDGWITPSNLKKHQSRDTNGKSLALSENKILQVATITSDFAMQNVLLQMGLNLLSTSIQQVRHIKTYILRCHACFQKTKDMSKQFCPRCGKPTLTRVSCSTNSKGEFQMHLKKNMQWSHRGDRYSIPKPVSGTASGKVGKGKKGGKGGWGQELILAEDQKEYVRAIQEEGRSKEKNLMDEDYLPSILTGERSRAGGRPKVGAGRNVNSKKR